MIDLSLHSKLFRVHYYCIHLDHILAVVIVVLGVLATKMSTVCLHVVVNSCIK